jgi:hypothetical protein
MNVQVTDCESEGPCLYGNDALVSTLPSGPIGICARLDDQDSYFLLPIQPIPKELEWKKVRVFNRSDGHRTLVRLYLYLCTLIFQI